MKIATFNLHCIVCGEHYVEKVEVEDHKSVGCMNGICPKCKQAIINLRQEKPKQDVPDRFWEFSPGVVLDAKKIDYIWKQWGSLYILISGVEKCLLSKTTELEEKYTELIYWWKYWNEEK